MTLINGYLETEEVKDDPFGVLHEGVYEFRDHVVEEAGRTAHKLKVAEMIADASPPEEGEPADPSERRYRVHLIARADGFAMARALLVNEAPKATGADRLVALCAVEAAHGDSEAEASEPA